MSIEKILEYIPRINKEGYLTLFLVALALFVVFSFIGGGSTIVGVLLVCAVALFFRDPQRTSPVERGYVVSPADGIITDISVAKPPRELQLHENLEMLRISVFLSVFDVHVNRFPTFGRVAQQCYHPGKFFSATSDKSSDLNERNSILIDTRDIDVDKKEGGAVDSKMSGGDDRESSAQNKEECFGSSLDIPDNKLVVVTQIAGLLARRIVSSAKIGDMCSAGEHYGIIKFGSRVDLYLPLGTHLIVAKGQRMVGGETIIAHLRKELSELGPVHRS